MKKIPGYDDYSITKDGRVWSHISNMWLKPVRDRGGYLYIHLCKNGGPHTRKIHRLVLETYVGPCPDGMECCHNNGICTDNRLENLRWDTHSNNAYDSVKHGTWADNRGEKHGRAKLNELQVRIIRRLLEFGNMTQREIAPIFGIHETIISKIKSRKIWK